MKTKTLTLLIIIFVASNSFGQGQFWRINGNNGITTNNFLGTINNAPLIIKTNGIQRLRITAAGSLQGWPGSIASGLWSIAFGFNTTANGDNNQVKRFTKKITSHIPTKLLIPNHLPKAY
jgi:hypothetical protein